MYIKLRIFFKKLFYDNPLIWKGIEFLQGLVYVFDYFYYYKLWGHDKRFSVKEINIEFSSQCNLRCKFCALDHEKPKHSITSEILEKFFVNFIEDKRFQQIEIINLHNGGETLLHPKLGEMLGIIKKYKDLAKEKGLRFPKISLLTNGMLLRERVSKLILDLDVIDTIGVSIDGGTPQVFEDFRVNAKWSKMYENVKTFHGLNEGKGHPTEMYSICCVSDENPLGTEWMHPEFQEVLGLFDRYELRRFHSWGGEIDGIASREKKHKIGCTMAMRQMVLLPNGDVTVCCNDLNSKGVVGNMMDKDFISVYKSQERQKYLTLLLKGQKSQLELCKDCETF
ncbi:MAG: radical SAM/SPASM domain-containing protein [Bacteroidia bacterium]